MRLILTILFFGLYAANANTYYVKNGGDDGADGLSDATAWESTTKVLATIVSGDVVNFKCGSTWTGQFKPSVSNITFQQYGTGLKPVFNGLAEATGWTDSSNIWRTTISQSVAYQNTIMIDGKLRAKGRYPNSTMLDCLVTGFNKMTFYVTLPQNYVGAELVLRNYVWILDVNKISAQSGLLSGDSMTIQTPFTYNSNFIGYSKFFIQNSVNVLDQPYEWAVDSLSKTLYVYSIDTPRNVFYSTVDTIISNHNVTDISYDGIKITGGNKAGFSTDTTRNITLQNAVIANSGTNAINLNKSHQTVFDNDSITDALNNGVYTRWQSDTCSFTNSYWKNIGKYAGMGASGNSASCGLFHYGLKSTFSGNFMDTIGYNGYYWLGNALVERNYIKNTALVKTDGGSIYSVPGVTTTQVSTVRNNIVEGGGSAGIYMDNQKVYVDIYDNTVSGVEADGIVLNGGNNYNVFRNTVLTTSNICFKTGNAIALANTSVTNNIFYSKYRSAPVYYSGILNGTVIQDSNRLLRSNASDSLFRYGQNLSYYSLTAWQSFSGKDASSTDTFPTNIVSSASGMLLSNPGNTDSTFTLSGLHKDSEVNLYNNSITLTSFQQGVILFKADYELSYRKKYGRRKFR